MALVVLRASIRYRKARAAVACAAVVLGCALPAALVGLGGSRERLERDLALYGANLLIVPRDSSAALGGASLEVFDRLVAGKRLDAYSPWLGVAADIDGRHVALVGVRVSAARELYPWWAVEGRWPDGNDSALLGADLAEKLGRRPGDGVTVRTRHATRSFRISGTVRSGGADDSRLFVDLDVAAELGGRRGELSLVHARARQGESLSGVAQAVVEAMPDAEVRTPIQALRATDAVLGRLRRLLLLLTAVVLTGSALAVFATAAAAAVERRSEVAVMKALGATRAWIVGIGAAEAAILGGLGGLGGFGIGLGLTEAIAWQVFGASIAPSVLALAASVAVGVTVTLCASIVSIDRLARLRAPSVLRGE